MLIAYHTFITTIIYFLVAVYILEAEHAPETIICEVRFSKAKEWPWMGKGKWMWSEGIQYSIVRNQME